MLYRIDRGEQKSIFIRRKEVSRTSSNDTLYSVLTNPTFDMDWRSIPPYVEQHKHTLTIIVPKEFL